MTIFMFYKIPNNTILIPENIRSVLTKNATNGGGWRRGGGGGRGGGVGVLNGAKL